MMKVLRYFASDRFKRYVPDMLAVVILVIYFFAIAEKAEPFNRQFKLSDPTIQHPFAINERVSGPKCILLASLVPLLVISGTVFFKNNWTLGREDQLYLLQNSNLGLFLSLAMTGVFTDILKNWIGKPRPDFIARCGPSSGTPSDIFVGIDVCTAPLGKLVLKDGMRSTPSGHSSISFSAFGYLSLWILGQLKGTHRFQPIYKILLALMPILLAFYVALSRTQDYRHHFIDIILGGLIGQSFALILYCRYFPAVWHQDSDKPHDEHDSMVLPSYTNP